MVFGNYGDTLGKTYREEVDKRRRLINVNRFKYAAKVDSPDGIAVEVTYDGTRVAAAVQALGVGMGYVLVSAAEALAQGLASANSPWPFVTGDSRAGFLARTNQPDEVSVDNDVHYAPYVEKYYDGVAEKYVARHIDEAIGNALDEYMQ